MSINYIRVQDILEERQLKYPEFGFLDNNGSVIKIMQWQPKGNLSFQSERGFRCSDSMHAQKAESFLKEAYNKKADIIITPEYSFPWNTVQKMIDNKSLYPSNGKLCCLGMEGISGEELKLFIEKNEETSDVCIVTENMDELQENYFFSCIAYLFKTTGKLICLIQFKTTPASDKWAELEAKCLTRGKTIYLFKSTKAEYYLLSYICADVLNQEIESIKADFPYQECLILHPQLNPYPLHETFDQMRKNFLDYDRHNTRIIGVNWARDTKLPKDGEREEVKIKDSFSACYYNASKDSREKEDTELLTRNKTKGIDLIMKNHSVIWYMPDVEHCMFYTIDCFANRMLSNVTGRHKEPVGDTYYEYCEEKDLWKPASVCRICRVDWKWIQDCFGINQCNEKCLVSLLHRFFSILLMGRTNGDFDLDHGRIQTVFHKEAQKDEILSVLREKCTYPNEALKMGKIPKKFIWLSNGNYKWILDSRGNLTTRDFDKRNQVYCVMYIDSSQELLIEKYINKFQKIMGEGACDRLIVYYMSVGGIQCYEKHYNTDINNPNNFNAVNHIN